MMRHHLHMPSYFLGTFTEYPYLYTNHASMRRVFIVSYQRVTRYQLLVDKKLRVCQQGINFLSTNS